MFYIKKIILLLYNVCVSIIMGMVECGSGPQLALLMIMMMMIGTNKVIVCFEFQLEKVSILDK